MKEQLKSIDERAKEELSHIDDAKLLEDFRVRFLGKKGEITSILKQMGKLSAEERPVIGQLANKVRADIENALNKRKEELKSKMEQVRLTEETPFPTVSSAFRHWSPLGSPLIRSRLPVSR